MPGDPMPSAGEIAVIGEVVESPGCSIRQLCERTGFVQSHVSAIVAELVERGLLRTETDFADRRRTLVHPDTPLTRGLDQRQSPIDEALAAALGDPGRAGETAVLIGRLAALLLTDRELRSHRRRSPGSAPMAVVRTAPGNHMRHIYGDDDPKSNGRSNQREIDVIRHEVLPWISVDIPAHEVGITTPYRRQADKVTDAGSSPSNPTPCTNSRGGKSTRSSCLRCSTIPVAAGQR